MTIEVEDLIEVSFNCIPVNITLTQVTVFIDQSGVLQVTMGFGRRRRDCKERQHARLQTSTVAN